MSRAERRARERAQAKKKKAGGRQRRAGLSRRATRIVTWTLVAVFVLAAGGWGLYSYLASPLNSKRVVAVVNGSEITERDMARRENVFMFLSGLKSLDPDTKKTIRDEVIQDYLIREEANRRGITASDQDVKDLTKQYEASLKILYKSSLNITVQRIRLRVGAQDIEDYIKASVINRKLYQAVTAQVTVTDADILALYQQYKDLLDKEGLSYEQAKDRLAPDALDKKRGETYTRFLDELKAKAVISTPG